MKLITVVVRADLDDEKNRYLDGTTIADHFNRIVNGDNNDLNDNVYLEFGSGDVVHESTLVAISIVEVPDG